METFSRKGKKNRILRKEKSDQRKRRKSHECERKIRKILFYAPGSHLRLGEEGYHHESAPLVQRGFAGRQSGADRTHEPGGKTGVF